MRVAVAPDDLQKPPACLSVIGRSVEQRLDVAADRGQRRAQLVRDVGDEVAPDLIGAPQIGDVVQDEHGTAAAGPETREPRVPRTCGRDRARA